MIARPKAAATLTNLQVQIGMVHRQIFSKAKNHSHYQRRNLFRVPGKSGLLRLLSRSTLVVEYGAAGTSPASFVSFLSNSSGGDLRMNGSLVSQSGNRKQTVLTAVGAKVDSIAYLKCPRIRPCEANSMWRHFIVTDLELGKNGQHHQTSFVNKRGLSVISIIAGDVNKIITKILFSK